MWAAPALALAQSQPPPAAHIRLASQTPWVAVGGEFDMGVVVTTDAPATALELAVTVFRQVSSRSEFLLTRQDRIRGSALSTTPMPLSDLTPDASGALTVRLPVQDPAQPADRARIRLRDEGVYPVRVELREANGGRSLDRLTTHLIYASAPNEGGVALDFAWVLPVSAPPALKPDAKRELDQASSDRLALLAQRLDAHPTVALNLQPTPETIAALAAGAREADKNTLETLTRVVKGKQVVSGTYVPVQPGAFGSGGEDEFAAQLDRGGDLLARLLGVRPDPRTWVTDERLDEAGLDRLRSQQVDRIVLPEAALAPVNLPVTLAQPFDLQTRALRRPTTVAADPELGNHFSPLADRPDDPVLRAHALLADLAVVYFDRPGKPRGVVALAPRNWSPDRAFLDVVLGGLASSPIVKSTTLDTLFSTVPNATRARNTTLTRPLAANPAAPALPLSAIHAARSKLVSFASMLDADNTIDDDLEELLLASESADLRGRQRTQYLDGVDKRIGAEVAHIQVPASRTITLTARRGEIPITVQWTGDYPVRIRLQVASDKLAFPNPSPAPGDGAGAGTGGAQGNTRTVDLSRRNTTERFAVQARTSGAFPLRITLAAPDGSLVLGRARFTVRSTAFSGVGIALSAGAGLILVVWWARHVHRGRRNRRLVPAVSG
jgi:hypothetical protein